MKTHHWILLVLTVLVVGAFFLWPQTNIQVPTDELTGTWRGQANRESEYQWWMEYTFDNGAYILTTDSSYSEQGTYEITERFLDGSILVKKVYADATKEYEMAVLISKDKPYIISIEGATLTRQ